MEDKLQRCKFGRVAYGTRGESVAGPWLNPENLCGRGRILFRRRSGQALMQDRFLIMKTNSLDCCLRAPIARLVAPAP